MDFEVNPELSFIQNILNIAAANDVKIVAISKASGIAADNMRPRMLAKNPLPNFHLMTENQAQETLKTAKVPAGLEHEFKKLAGYPQKSADWYLQQFAADNPHLAELKALEEAGFGYAFRLNRKEIKRGGVFLRLADCVMPEFQVSSSVLSHIETGSRQAKIATAYKLIGQLGYRPDQEGFEAFCLESGKLLEDYLQRASEFGKALFIHLYPEGETSGLNKVSDRVTQGDIIREIGGSQGRIKNFFTGKDVPNQEDALAISRLFGFSSEAAFYTSSRRKHAEAPHVKPQVIPSSKEMAEFGRKIKVIRDEIGLRQDRLEQSITEIGGNIRISKLELGERVIPLSEEQQNLVMQAMHFSDAESFTAFAVSVENLQHYRQENFVAAVSKLAAEGDNLADQIMRPPGIGGYLKDWVSPHLARQILKQMDLTESELYLAAKCPGAEGIIQDSQIVDQFIAANDFHEMLGDTAKVGWRPKLQRGKITSGKSLDYTDGRTEHQR